jgi:hypothetical protein
LHRHVSSNEQVDVVTAIERRAQGERDACRLLYAGFIVAPLVAGFDKFTDKLGNWDRYLADGVADNVRSSVTPSCRRSAS